MSLPARPWMRSVIDQAPNPFVLKGFPTVGYAAMESIPWMRKNSSREASTPPTSATVRRTYSGSSRELTPGAAACSRHRSPGSSSGLRWRAGEGDRADDGTEQRRLTRPGCADDQPVPGRTREVEVHQIAALLVRTVYEAGRHAEPTEPVVGVAHPASSGGPHLGPIRRGGGRPRWGSDRQAGRNSNQSKAALPCVEYMPMTRPVKPPATSVVR